VEIRNIDANGMTYRCREAGTAGEPVICCTASPRPRTCGCRSWNGSRLRAIAASRRTKRGYSPGARPEGADHYRYIDTASDVVALADAWGAGASTLSATTGAPAAAGRSSRSTPSGC